MLHCRHVRSKTRRRNSRLTVLADGGDESTIWDEEWLHDHNLPLVLDRKAVTMMFARESDEAGFLDAFCPITTVPFLAVIQCESSSYQYCGIH